MRDVGSTVLILGILFVALVGVGFVAADKAVLDGVAKWADAAFIALLVLLNPTRNRGGGNPPGPDATKADD